MNKTIGLKIKKIRIENELSQDEFSNIVGISKKDLSNFENNVSNIPIDILRKIIEIFDINANWLLLEKEKIRQNDQKIGNISNSTVVAANVSGDGISINHTIPMEAIDKYFKNQHKGLEKIQGLIGNLITSVSKLNDKIK